MIHTKRRFCVTQAQAQSPEQLARDLCERTWTCCTGFQFGSYLFLNDSTSEDGAQEYAVILIRDASFLQIESITFGWCTEAEALRYVQDALAGKMDENSFAKPVELCLELPEAHGRCHLCA